MCEIFGLEHLDEKNSAYFDRCVKDLEWKKEENRHKIFAGVSKRYDSELAEDIIKLYEFYTKF